MKKAYTRPYEGAQNSAGRRTGPSRSSFTDSGLGTTQACSFGILLCPRTRPASLHQIVSWRFSVRLARHNQSRSPLQANPLQFSSQLRAVLWSPYQTCIVIHSSELSLSLRLLRIGIEVGLRCVISILCRDSISVVLDAACWLTAQRRHCCQILYGCCASLYALQMVVVVSMSQPDHAVPFQGDSFL